MSPLPSGVVVLFVRLPESYPPRSREAGGVVIYRCRGHPFRDGPTPDGKDPYYYKHLLQRFRSHRNATGKRSVDESRLKAVVLFGSASWLPGRCRRLDECQATASRALIPDTQTTRPRWCCMNSKTCLATSSSRDCLEQPYVAPVRLTEPRFGFALLPPTRAMGMFVRLIQLSQPLRRCSPPTPRRGMLPRGQCPAHLYAARAVSP